MKRALAVLACLTLPGAAHACAVCGAAADRNRSIFLFTTILLSLLPLALVGAGLLWLARRARGRLAGEFAEREVGPGDRGPEAPGGARVAATPAGGREA